MDRIVIKDLKLYGYHGVNPEEKENGQPFVLDITAELDLSVPCETDNVEDTVSYAKIIKTVASVFNREKYDLIEKAARVTADAVLDAFPKVDAVEITLKKPEAPVKAAFAYVAVSIRRDRHG
ncbi:MAG: dihydroneopterin aldolase [Clostridia bacterium]|nr:dihydroneopterin aldolase [Clostridia bacterium]